VRLLGTFCTLHSTPAGRGYEVCCCAAASKPFAVPVLRDPEIIERLLIHSCADLPHTRSVSSNCSATPRTSVPAASQRRGYVNPHTPLPLLEIEIAHLHTSKISAANVNSSVPSVVLRGRSRRCPTSSPSRGAPVTVTKRKMTNVRGTERTRHGGPHFPNSSWVLGLFMAGID
jgi:hypothetical protein